MSKEAIKMALEALNKLTDAAEGFSVSGVYFNEGVWEKECLNTSYAAIKALEEALAKQEQGEPFCWYDMEHGEIRDVEWNRLKPTYEGVWRPLYTTPQQRKPLTDDEIYEMYNEPRSDAEMIAFARAIEAAHGIRPSDFK